MSGIRRFFPRALLAAGALAACSPPPPPAAPAPAADPVKRVRIVHTNDFHGRLLPQQVGGRAAGGSAVLAAHFDSAAARAGGPTIILSAGDDMQGTAISNLSWGRATIAAHNAAGYDAAAVGNHEFDWGQDTLVARVRESRFPWLAANVFVQGTRRQPEWLRPWVMIERGGVRTAVIGIALPGTPEIVLVGRTAGLEFGPEAPAIDQAAREARAAGADFVVVTAHVGASCEQPGTAPAEPSAGCRGEILEMADALTEPVDLIVGGHSHRRVLTEEDGIPVLEASSYSMAYSLTDLERRGGRTVAVRREVRVPFADEVTPDTQVARIVAEWERNVRPITERVITTLAQPMEREEGEYALGNLIADALRVQAGAQVSLVNNGSIRRALPAGPVCWGVLFELQPFANALVRVEVTGAQLREALENAVRGGGSPDAHIAGMTVRYDPAAPEGQRVREIRLDNGQVVDADDVVTVGLSEFIATGGDRYTSFTRGRITRTEMVDLDAVIAYLQSLPQPVEPPALGRWQPVR